MSEENKTAETTENVVNTPVGADSHADIDKSGVNDAEFTDTEGQEESKPMETKEPEATPKESQSREVNSENARRRREEERQKELHKAREQAIIETLKGKNPYTNEDIKDSEDVEEYLTMRKIEESGGDPIADFSKYQKQKVKEEKAQVEEKTKQEEWLINDRELFIAKHPEVVLEKLIADQSFRLFAEGKVGTVPMNDIYESFIKVVEAYESKAKQKAARIVANANASPGSLTSPSEADNGFYTKEQVQNMSPTEVKKNYDKIRASMAKWSY